MEKDKRTGGQAAFLIKAAYYALWAGIIYFIVKLAGTVLLPFLAAFGLAYALNGAVVYLQKKIRIKRSLASFLVVGTFFLLLAAAACGLIYGIYSLAGGFFSEMGELFTERVLPELKELMQKCDTVLGSAGLGKNDGAFSEKLAGKIPDCITACVSKAAGCIPGIGMNIIILVIAAFFIEMDLPEIHTFLQKNLPEKWKIPFQPGKKKLFLAVGRYLGAYALIFLITFGELTLGFFILKIKNGIFLALMTAILDILPVFGTGTVLLPWGLFQLICKDRMLGIGILLLYLVITVVRNFIEPRLVGRQMGLSPVVTLPAMLLGYRILGIAGLFLFPIGIAIINSLNQKNIIHLYKN